MTWFLNIKFVVTKDFILKELKNLKISYFTFRIQKSR